jgi:hypothetical protein
MFYIKEYIGNKHFPHITQNQIKTFNTEAEAAEYLKKLIFTGHIHRGSKVAKQK